jgi:cell division protein FtsZ
MTIKLSMPDMISELKPRITVIGVGGAGGNAINNMIRSNLEGVEFVVTNTDAQALSQSLAERLIQLGASITQGLGAGSRPDIGRAAAEENIDDILEHLYGSHMAFITAGMGGGTGTGAAPVIARAAREQGILTVGVVTKPFQFEGIKRMRMAEAGIEELQQFVDTLIVIPNQNLFRVANEKTTFADAFKMADDVLYSGVRGVTDLMVMPGLINLDFADIRTVMTEMGKAQMGTGEAEGDKRAIDAAEAAISNPLLDDVSMKGARGVLINITGGPDMMLFEVDEAANRIREEVDAEANIIFGSTFDETLEGRMRVSVVATGIDADAAVAPKPSTVSWLSEHRRAAEREAAASTSLAAVRPFIPPSGTTAQAAASAVAGARPALRQEQAPSPDAERDSDAVAAPAEEEETDLPFIAPRPVELSRSPEPALNAEPVAEPEPFAAAAMANGVGEPAKARSRGLSLFERVTGTGRARKTAFQRPPEPAAESPQPRLGGLESAERIAPAPSHDDILDIPAFLRRQAN